MAGKMMRFEGPDGKTYLFESPETSTEAKPSIGLGQAFDAFTGGPMKRAIAGKVASDAVNPDTYEGYGAMAGGMAGPLVPAPLPPSVKTMGGAAIGSGLGQATANVVRGFQGKPTQPFDAMKTGERALEAGATYGLGKAIYGGGPGASTRFGEMLERGGSAKTVDFSNEMKILKRAYETAKGDLTNPLYKTVARQTLKPYGVSDLEQLIESGATKLTRTEAQDFVNTFRNSSDATLRDIAKSTASKVYKTLGNDTAGKLLYEGYGMAKRGLGVAKVAGKTALKGAGLLAGAKVAGDVVGAALRNK